MVKGCDSLKERIAKGIFNPKANTNKFRPGLFTIEKEKELRQLLGMPAKDSDCFSTPTGKK